MSWRGAVALGVTAMLLITAASAASKIKTRSSTAQLSGHTSKTVVATCPRKTHVVSAGFATTSSVPDQNETFVTTSRAKGSRSWLMVGQSRSFANQGTVRDLVYCSGSIPVRVRISKRKIVPSGRSRTTTATCPRGKTAISGGFIGKFADGGAEIYPYASYRAGKRSWKVGAFNDGNPGPLKALVLCSKGPALKSRKAKGKAAAAQSASKATARCPKRTSAISGGFNSPGFAVMDVNASAVIATSSHRSGSRAWRAGGFNFGFVAGSTVAYVYCR